MINKSLSFLFTFCFALSVFAQETTLKAVMSARPNSTDPVFLTLQSNSNVITQIFEGLYSTDKNGNDIFGQAKSLEISDDRKTYTYTLRDDIFWSDGVRVTANDFVQAWRRVVDPNIKGLAKPNYLMSRIVNADEIIEGKRPSEDLGVTALDDVTLEIKINTQTPFLPKILSHGSFSPIPWHIVKNDPIGWAQKRPQISNGPFTLAGEENAGDGRFERLFKLKKNPYYYDRDSVYYEDLILIALIKEENKKAVDPVVFLIENEADIIIYYRSVSKEWVNSVIQPQTLFSSLSHTVYLAFNLEDPVISDPRIREALILAIDANEMNKRLGKPGLISTAVSFAPKSVAAQWNPVVPKRFTMSKQERSDRVKSLLAESGYDKNNPLKIKFRTTRLPSARALREEWSQFAIETEILSTDSTDYYEVISDGDYQIARAGWAHDYDDPSSYLDNLKSNSPNNFSNWNNAEYDALIARSYEETDPKLRAEIFQELENLIESEHPILPLSSASSVSLIRQGIEGVVYANTPDLYLKHARPTEPLTDDRINEGTIVQD